MNVLKAATAALVLLAAAGAAQASDVDVEAGSGSTVNVETTEIHKHYHAAECEEDYDDDCELRPRRSSSPRKQVYQTPAPPPVYRANACQNPYAGRYLIYGETLMLGQPCMISLYPPVGGVGTIF